MSAIDWRVYYSDFTTFDSSQGDPEDVPAYGVVCITQRDSLTGRLIMHKWDWYYYVPEDSLWWGSDTFGLLDRLCHRLPAVAVCQGRNVSNADYRLIMEMADKDKDFPVKSGKQAIEQPFLTAQKVDLR